MPIFDKVDFTLGDKIFSIVKKNAGRRINSITYGDKKISDYFISHDDLKKGKQLVITTDK